MGLRRFIPLLRKGTTPQSAAGQQGQSAAELVGQASALAHGIYHWLRHAKPGSGKHAVSELGQAKAEIAQLREQLQRTEEERDTLKKALAYFAKDPQQ